MSFRFICQALYFAQLIYFPMRWLLSKPHCWSWCSCFPVQSARLCLCHYAYNQSSCTDRLLYRYGKQVAELR